MKKISWIVNWPNQIYVNLGNGLSKYFNLNMVLISNYKKLRLKKENYSYSFFQYYKKDIISLIKKITYFPNVIKYKNFNKEIKKTNPNLIISNIFFFPSTSQAAKYCKKNNIPFILQTEVQSYPKNIIRKILLIILLIIKKPIFKQAKYILPWTKKGEDFLKKRFPEFKNKIINIPAGINLNIFYKTKEKHKTKFKILYVGRFVPCKRHIDLIQAIYELNKENKLNNVEINLLGEGPLKNEIKKLIKEKKIENKINFLDKIPYQKMKDLYSEHDFHILPSFNEAIGMCVPEAMACGTPCVVSDSAGGEMYVEHGKNGYIFKTYDVQDLKNKILLMLDKEKVKEFGNNAEKHIKENYDVKIIANKFELIINKTFQ